MSPFLSTSKAVGSAMSRRNAITQFVSHAKNGERSGNLNKIRWVTSISGPQTPLLCSRKEASIVPLNNIFNHYTLQRRQFLGCGDGEEGSVLAKVYEEKIIMWYLPGQLYDVVAAVDLYHGFPWCQRCDIVRRYPDGSFDAELEIGFKFLVESYVSHVELSKRKFVKSTASESSLFGHLINIWEFSPGSVPGTCNLYFLADFKFQSPLYRQVMTHRPRGFRNHYQYLTSPLILVASMFFKEVVSRMISSFSEHCRLIYGPGVPVLENSYGERT